MLMMNTNLLGFRGIRFLKCIPTNSLANRSCSRFKYVAVLRNLHQRGKNHHSPASVSCLSYYFSTTSTPSCGGNNGSCEERLQGLSYVIPRLHTFTNRQSLNNLLRTFATKTSPPPKTEEQQPQNHSKSKQSSENVQFESITRTENHEKDNNTGPTTDDTSPRSWVDTALPISFQPYARLARMDKPIGTMLLLWPCFWSTALATPPSSLPDFELLALFGAGAFIMRGAGCTINDMWDSDFDKSVARTKTRPLASGQLSHKQATGFLALQLASGLGVLVSLPHTWYCFQLGAASLPLVIAYPLMKRYTNWPQLVLGMTFNWGAFMGWAATHGSLDANVVGPLYVSGIAWTLVYDTLYAHQDKKDDAKLGLKSTALHFGEEYTKPILYGFSTISWLGWNLAGLASMSTTHPLFFLGTTAAWSHLLWQIRTADLNDSQNLATRFKSNNTVGAIVFGSMAAGTMLS